jgi:hypothetical protein
MTYLFGEKFKARGPFKLFLFIMVMEGLTTLINQVVESSDIHGVKTEDCKCMCSLLVMNDVKIRVKVIKLDLM